MAQKWINTLVFTPTYQRKTAVREMLSPTSTLFAEYAPDERFMIRWLDSVAFDLILLFQPENMREIRLITTARNYSRENRHAAVVVVGSTPTPAAIRQLKKLAVDDFVLAPVSGSVVEQRLVSAWHRRVRTHMPDTVGHTPWARPADNDGRALPPKDRATTRGKRRAVPSLWGDIAPLGAQPAMA